MSETKKFNALGEDEDVVSETRDEDENPVEEIILLVLKAEQKMKKRAK